MKSKTSNQWPELGLHIFSLICAGLLFWILLHLVAYHFDDQLNGWEMQGDQMGIVTIMFLPVVLISLPLCKALKRNGELTFYRILAFLVAATVVTALLMFFSLLNDPNFQ
jgi:hypothetical protein